MSLKLSDISKLMRDIDICMMTTKTPSGTLESRPMSNNREVDYTGDSYFFANGDCSAVRDIEADPQADLSFIHRPALIGDAFYLSVSGKAALVRDKAEMKKHWVKDVELWFKDGIDTPGLVMIHVKASSLKYWKGGEEGALAL